MGRLERHTSLVKWHRVKIGSLKASRAVPSIFFMLHGLQPLQYQRLLRQYLFLTQFRRWVRARDETVLASLRPGMGLLSTGFDCHYWPVTAKPWHASNRTAG